MPEKGTVIEQLQSLVFGPIQCAVAAMGVSQGYFARLGFQS